MYFECPQKDFNKWSEIFKNIDVDFISATENPYGWIEAEFESPWDFPDKVFKEIMPNGIKDIYFRCLSEEPGFDYFACNVYKNGYWQKEQYFEV
jgi:hypothetical protein